MTSHAIAPPPRVDGFAPIGGYAAIGDGHSVALVALDGSIDWWPLPTIDAPPVFAAILDPEHGGDVALAPEDPYTVRRHYVRDTNVLETTYTTATGSVTVTDALTLGHDGALRCCELVRVVEGTEGAVAMRWRVAPGTRFESARPWTETRRDTALLHSGDQHLAVRAFAVGDPVVEPHRVTGRFVTSPGSRHLFALTTSDDVPLLLSDRPSIEHRLDLTIRREQEWSAGISYQGPWRDEVMRSANALKLLVNSGTGAIAAAATTSLPERLGGDKNWDYRYMWVRDASFSADALLSLGLDEEVHAVVMWLLSTLRKSGTELQVFYKLDGSQPQSEQDLDAPGYRGSRPVRSGNTASAQLQLGNFGDLFDTVWRFVERGHVLDPDTGQLLVGVADRCADSWTSEDAGIWELHVDRHYTISKMGCWVALDRAVRLAELGEITTGHADRWVRERDEVRNWIHRHCWSEARQSYTFYAGTDELDAATLLAARTGFDTGARLSSTIDAVRAELADGPLVYRYTGMRDEEGAFLACSFWVVDALTVVGRLDEARRLMDEATALANDVGLLAEEMSSDGEMLGNFPQALSHLALINAATRLASATATGLPS